jgi:nicotinamidase-related amidase
MEKRAFVLFFAVLALAGCATVGKHIGTYADPRRALLVMDVQKDFTTEGAPMPVDLDMVLPMIMNINTAVSTFQQHGDLVIYVRNVFPKNDIANIYRHNAAVEGSPGIAFDDRLLVVSDRVFDKSKPDAFSNPEFESYLQRS